MLRPVLTASTGQDLSQSPQQSFGINISTPTQQMRNCADMGRVGGFTDLPKISAGKLKGLHSACVLSPCPGQPPALHSAFLSS